MPIRRSIELTPLSRQHHNGLLCCLLLHKGLLKQADLDVMQEFIQQFWYKDLQHHFGLEEECLSPFVNHFEVLNGPIRRMLDEHHDIRSLINSIALDASYQGIQELSDRLEQHIRFEERELFPLVEQTITTEQMTAIGKILAHEADDNCMNYPVKFWE